MFLSCGTELRSWEVCTLSRPKFEDIFLPLPFIGEPRMIAKLVIVPKPILAHSSKKKKKI